MKIVWIASYPRSGNTWVRLLLFNYLYGGTEQSELINDRIPDLHLLSGSELTFGQKTDGPGCIKSHYKWSEKHPHAKNTEGFIYILRNPRDVLLSNARYLGYESTASDLREFAEVFIRQLGVPRWLREGFGIWPEHAESWLAAARGFPGVFVRYEDLRADTELQLGRMLQMIGRKPDKDRVRSAVSKSSLQQTKLLEVSEKAQGEDSLFGMVGQSGFVDQGLTGQSLEFIGADIEALYRERFGPVVEPFGYA